MDQGHQRRDHPRRGPRALRLLHRLEERGWVESQWGLSENNRKAKYYELTTAGQRHLKRKASEFTTYAHAVFKILETV